MELSRQEIDQGDKRTGTRQKSAMQKSGVVVATVDSAIVNYSVQLG